MLQKHSAPDSGQPTFTFDDRHWRVCGLEKELSSARLRVNLRVSRCELVHVDTLDLYTARSRRMFVKEAAAELYVEEAVIKQDLGRVLLALEEEQDRLIDETFARQEPEVPVMTDRERADALQLLEDPHLLDRILDDYEACGLVGEHTNKLICYLACVSRHLPQPLAVLVQSSSAAGKTSLLEGTLALMPEEEQRQMSALTGQALFYMGRTELKHKILAVAEEQGAAEASYALKLLQSEGRLSIACVGKDSGTGRSQTQHYEMEGPVAMLLTTTAEEPDTELANRCMTLSVCEQPQQTTAIQSRQRAAYLPSATKTTATANSAEQREAIQLRHQHAQRLLQPLGVVIPYAEQLTFRTDQARHRRDHAKYLSLIATLALLFQYQRERTTRDGQPCVVATLGDLAAANRLASETLAVRADGLLPQTRLLLQQLDTHVTQRAEKQAIARSEVRFTQRELRETLHWSDRALRRQLSRLVELEYVLVYRTGRGNGRTYQLLYDRPSEESSSWQLGLRDVESVRRNTAAVSHAGKVQAHPPVQ